MNYLAALLILGNSLLAIAQLPPQDALSDAAKQTLDQVVVAYRSGQLHEVLRLLGSALETTPPDKLQIADEYLRGTHELNISVLNLSVDVRVQLVLEGQGTRLPRPTAIERPALLVALDDRISQLMDPVRRELDVGFPALIPDDVLNEKVPAIAALLAQIDQADLLLTHIGQVTARLPAKDRAALKDRAATIAARKSSEEQRKLDDLRDRLAGRLVEFSVVRLNNAAAVLSNESSNFIARFQAAIRAEDSLAIIHSRWDRYKTWKRRNGGLTPEVETRWRAVEQQLRTSAAGFREKVVHFNEGTRLWLLGRFGRGPVADGLARPGRVAGVSDSQARASLTPLVMPVLLRKPEDPATVPIPFPVARRHLEWWRYPVEPSQLVGFAEYSAALNHFERLLQMTSSAEQSALEELIAADDRFVVHSELSKRFDALEPGSTLRVASRLPHPKAARPTERRGLSWIMAHARVELEAMHAFRESGTGSAVSTKPTQFEQEAHRELLLDSARQHYYECVMEFFVERETPFVRQRSRNEIPPRATILMYQFDRKLLLTMGLVQAFRPTAAGRLTASQEQELDQWFSRLTLQRQSLREVMQWIAEANGNPGRGGLPIGQPFLNPPPAPNRPPAKSKAKGP